MKPIIAVDFDGVIHGYSKGWSDGSIYDDPIPGCREALLSLSEQYRIIIFSTRNYDRVINGEGQANQVEEMTDWLNKHRIPYDEIHTGHNKPVCKLFIDDNAYRFKGDWQRCVNDVNSLLEVPGSIRLLNKIKELEDKIEEYTIFYNIRPCVECGHRHMDNY